MKEYAFVMNKSHFLLEKTRLPPMNIREVFYILLHNDFSAIILRLYNATKKLKKLRKNVYLLLHIYAHHVIIYAKLRNKAYPFLKHGVENKQNQGVFYEKEDIYRWKRRHNGA
jgi:hypothetical protein